MILDLAKSLSVNGHKCYIYSYAGNNTQLSIPDNIVYVPGTPFFKNRVLKHFLKIFPVRKTIKRVHPDLIVSFLPYPSIISIFAKIGLKIKIVFSERVDPSIYKGFIKIIGHRILSHADGAVFQLESAKDFYIRTALHDKSVVIPNAVTLTKKPRVELDKRTNEIAFVARFDIRQKRQDLMIEAFVLILRRYPDIKLVFYGDGPDEPIIRELVKKHSIESNVIFAGSVSPIDKYISNKRLFVLSSEFEGIPNALIEAMCVGLPCVATDCTPGGARFLIQDGVNGLIVPRGNPEELADACCRVLNDPELAERLGMNAQNVIDRFSPPRIYKKWNQYLTKVYKGSGFIDE